jgi:hypothetical protein
VKIVWFRKRDHKNFRLTQLAESAGDARFLKHVINSGDLRKLSQGFNPSAKLADTNRKQTGGRITRRKPER